ncbi:MAG: hypothetical protein ACK5NK_02420 [Niabella sp.]
MSTSLKPQNISIKPPILDFLNIFNFRSQWANDVINLSEPLAGGQWDDAGTYKFPKGYLLAKNDANYLYFAMDVVDDTGNDPVATAGDYFWLSFDNDRNKGITSNKDINYALYPNQAPKLARQYYLGAGSWTGILNTPSSSEVKLEFGPSERSATPHKIWKFKILLSEIGVNIAIPFFLPYTFFGFRINSTNPAFTYDFPTNFFKDFRGLKKLVFARKPKVINVGPLVGSIGLIPTTKITAGRASTDPGYFVQVLNAAFGGTLNFIGNRTKLQSLFTAGNTKYNVSIKGPGDATFKPLVSAWTNYVWDGSDYELKSFSGIDGNYTLVNPSVDYSIDDLLIQFPTTGFDNGLHTIKTTFYVGNSTTVADTQDVTLFIDNRLPTVSINKIKHGSNEVSTCAIEQLGAAPDGLNFDITASDPEGNLLSVSLVAQAGSGHSYTLYSEGYNTGKGNWAGFANKAVPDTGNWRPPFQCSYNFVLRANARTTNGYSYIGHVTDFKGLTVLI